MLRDRSADPFGGAGDDGDPVLELAHVMVPLAWPAGHAPDDCVRRWDAQASASGARPGGSTACRARRLPPRRVVVNPDGADRRQKDRGLTGARGIDVKPSAWRAVAAATTHNAPLGSLYAFSVFLKPLEALLGL